MTLSSRTELAHLAFAPPPEPQVDAPHRHTVQFYQDDGYLLDELARFVGAALGAGDAAVVIATESHRSHLGVRLRALGLDPEQAERQGRYVPLDAAEVLDRCLRDGRPDATAFLPVLRGIIDRAAASVRSAAPRVAVFGEMVALLCADGRGDDAVALERIWNTVPKEHNVDILCAYPMASFARADDAGRFADVCAAHSRVLPVETYRPQATESERLRTIVTLQQHAQALEVEVVDRRRAQDDLRQRNEELRTAIAIRDEFLSVAAHELKTPLTTLRAYVQRLLRERQRGGEPSPQRLEVALAAIEQQTGKLAQLIERLLDSAQIQAGRLRVAPVITDLVPLVWSAVAQYRDLPEHPLVLRCPERLETAIDPLRFEQVLSNLVDNAVKFSPEGGRVTVELDREPDGRVRLAVTDEGIGIPSADRTEIFNRFHPAHEQRHLSGMGFGLYVTREIVELHGGRLWVEDPPHPGSRFVVTLPAPST
ncbi:MAG TPA: ATP-binding protein [Thermomicrobiaceae bacterium]|nr:ATP-binding protein [Thermomicrobiaceae bacterium]